MPIHIIVGSKDTEERAFREGQVGNNRLERAKNWKSAMTDKMEGQNGKIQLTVVEGISHEPFKMLKEAHMAIKSFISPE